MSRHIEHANDMSGLTGVSVPTLGGGAEIQSDEKIIDEITPVSDEKAAVNDPNLNEAQRQALRERYAKQAEADGIAPTNDVEMILDRVIDMSDEEALSILLEGIEEHRADPNFPGWTMSKLRNLVQGYKACDMAEEEWSFDLRTEAAILKYHSPYPEVRAVTEPFDDPTIPVETIRSYTLGMILMAGSTGLNTFFSQRQPAIGLNSLIMQLLLAPLGFAWAKWMPNWQVGIGKYKAPLNHGPWHFKEQCFATVLFTIVNGAGSAQLLILIQRLPIFFGLDWLNWGYMILISLALQAFGFGLAGLMRRIVIYPPAAIWPSILPKIALNRALVVQEKRETINGWKLTRYHFFLLAFGVMWVYFWIPNTLFKALRLFNWMTWIAPNNYALGMITGSYGGMGFNPWATFDYNVSGNGMLTTPFFSTVQQYVGRMFGGFCIIAMHWSNQYWAGYMPINSNQLFNRFGGEFKIDEILGDDDYVDLEKYQAYGPPYWSGAAMFTQAGWYAWYLICLPLIMIRYWREVKAAFVGIWRSIRHKSSMYEGQMDPHSRMMAQYKEVPDWWYMGILVVCLGMGLIATQVWPTMLPPWALFAVLLFHLVLLVPSSVIESYANVRMDGGILFLVLIGVWLSGNPKGLMVGLMFGTQFGQQTDNFIQDLKFGHYAKIPPRALFRGQIFAVLLNCFIWLGLTNWMIDHFQPGQFCEWSNKDHMVCPGAHGQFALALMYGGFGVKNLFKMYPILPYIFLLAGVVGLGWALAEKYGPRVRHYTKVKAPDQYVWINRLIFLPIEYAGWLDPAIASHGMVDWTGGTNLSYYTNGVYLSFIFMHYLRKNYSAWWQKYNYLLEAGFGLGIAISGIIQTLIFAMGNGGKGYTLEWWGNTVPFDGVDYRAYNQNASLYPIPEIGYFGLAPEDFPMDF